MRTDLFKLALSVVAIAVGIVSLNREWSQSVRHAFQKQEREVLSTVVGDIFGNGTKVEVAKVRTSEGIVLEIYLPNENGSHTLVEKILLDQEKDGYFTFNGQLVSLAIDDIDGDAKMEILAPAFDHQLTAHLNVFKYDPQSNRFQKVLSRL